MAEVMARYRIRDRRAARRVMDLAGAFRIGACLYVRRSDLLELEERRRAARRAGPEVPAVAPPPGRSRRPLEPGWWREDDSERGA